jgi:stage III sporulation protein AF
MIDFLSGWVKNIIYIIFFIVFLEILLPNNSMRKYVKVVAGLLVMVVILTPITRLINNNLNLQDAVAKSFVDIDQIDIKSKNLILEGKQNDMTIRIFKEKVENQIKNQIENNIEGVSADVEIEIYEDPNNEDFGSIKEVYLYLNEKESQDSNNEDNETEESKANEIKPIEKIEIGELNEEQDEDESEDFFIITQDKEREIKEYFLDFYNVPSQNISINKQRNNMGEEEQ